MDIKKLRCVLRKLPFIVMKDVYWLSKKNTHKQTEKKNNDNEI